MAALDSLELHSRFADCRVVCRRWAYALVFSCEQSVMSTESDAARLIDSGRFAAGLSFRSCCLQPPQSIVFMCPEVTLASQKKVVRSTEVVIYSAGMRRHDRLRGAPGASG